MTAFDPALDIWTPRYDRFGNFYCWQHRDTKELRYLAFPPGSSPALPPGGFAGARQPKIPIDPSFIPAARPPTEVFTPPEIYQDLRFHNAPLKVPKAPYERGSAKPELKDMRSPPPFPPNNFNHPPSRSKSSAKKAQQWLLQRNKKGEEYYLNTKTLAWQLQTPDCLKKYTSY